MTATGFHHNREEIDLFENIQNDGIVRRIASNTSDLARDVQEEKPISLFPIVKSTCTHWDPFLCGSPNRQTYLQSLPLSDRVS
jgi:hypothetical protein